MHLSLAHLLADRTRFVGSRAMTPIFLGRVAVVVLAMAWLFACGDQRKRELVVLSYGGDFAVAQRKAFFDPFTERTGIPVRDEVYNGEYGVIREAVEQGSVRWDVVDLESSALLRGRQDGIFQAIDYTEVDTSSLIPGSKHELGVATDFYSVSLGWNAEKIQDPPRTWTEFWDMERFPGPRTLRRDPRFTLEIALMADGVPPEDIYRNGQLDVERAFRSLDRIRRAVKYWWTDGQEPVQLLAQGKVDLAAAYGARMYNAKVRDGLPIDMQWRGGIIDVEYWAIPAGAPNPDLAHRFIDFASGAESQARFTKEIPLGPVNLDAFLLLGTRFAHSLNSHPENFREQLLLNAEFWAENEARISKRFENWLALEEADDRVNPE